MYNTSKCYNFYKIVKDTMQKYRYALCVFFVRKNRYQVGEFIYIYIYIYIYLLAQMSITKRRFFELGAEFHTRVQIITHRREPSYPM
jgi:hypothetical protein